MRYISIPIYYENVIDTKHCNLLNGNTALLLNILLLPKEKLKVINVLNKSNNIKHISKRIEYIPKRIPTLNIFQNVLTRLLTIIKMTYFQIELEN